MDLFEDPTKVDLSSLSLTDLDYLEVRRILAAGHEAEAYFQTTFETLTEFRLKAVDMYPRLTVALMSDNSF